MKEIIEKIKHDIIYNKLFSNVKISDNGNVLYTSPNSNGLIFFAYNNETYISYKYVENIIGITYNRYIHDMMIKFIGFDCLLFYVYDWNKIKYITIDEYEEISR